MILMFLTMLKIANVKIYLLIQKDVWDTLIERSINISGKYLHARKKVWKNLEQDINHLSLGDGTLDNDSFFCLIFLFFSIMRTY